MPWAKGFCPYRACWVFSTAQIENISTFEAFEAFGAVASLQGSLFVLLELLQACKGYFLCFWSCCRLARVTFCAFGAVAGLQGLLFVLLELLQACKGYFFAFEAVAGNFPMQK